jgi:hypothetical protein
MGWSGRTLAWATAPVLALCASGAHATGDILSFTPGAYYYADDCPGATTPCAGASNVTVTLTISGSEATFVIDAPLDPTYNVTFSLPNFLTPTGYEPGASPYYSGPALVTSSWDTTAYPYVIFWSSVDGGAFNISASPDGSDSLVTLFQSVGTVGPSIASLVPEPAAWSMMVLGFGLSGALLRRRRTVSAA